MKTDEVFGMSTKIDDLSKKDIKSIRPNFDDIECNLNL